MELLDEAGSTWAVGHTFRKTVATWMDADPGTTPREVANQLGQAGRHDDGPLHVPEDGHRPRRTLP
jgi:hypothetical protein